MKCPHCKPGRKCRECMTDPSPAEIKRRAAIIRRENGHAPEPERNVSQQFLEELVDAMSADDEEDLE